VAGAAAAVEDAGSLAIAHGLGEQGRHEPAEPFEPEMIAFGPRRGLK